jgi:hypothetical protein
MEVEELVVEIDVVGFELVVIEPVGK